MAIQKKSLITNLNATKKAVVASKSATPATANAAVLSPVRSMKGVKLAKSQASLKNLRSHASLKSLRAQTSTKSMRGLR